MTSPIERGQLQDEGDAREQVQWVSIGFIVRAHGLRGLVRLRFWNAQTELLAEPRAVRLHLPDGATHQVKLSLVGSNPSAGQTLAQIDNVVDRDGAEALRGAHIEVRRDDLPALQGDEFYDVDAEGLLVRTDDGTPIGIVSRVLHYPTADCLEIDIESGSVEVPLLKRYLVGFDWVLREVTLRRIDEIPMRNLPRPKPNR